MRLGHCRGTKYQMKNGIKRRLTAMFVILNVELGQETSRTDGDKWRTIRLAPEKRS